MTRNPKSKTRPIAGVTTCLNVKTQYKRLVKNPTPNKLYGLYSLGGEVGLGGFSFSPVELPGATVQKEVSQQTGGSEFSAFFRGQVITKQFQRGQGSWLPLLPHKQSSHRDCARQIPLITPQ